MTKKQLNNLIHYCSKQSENFWSFSHNCASVGYRAWNYIVDDENKVDPYIYFDKITNNIATSKGLYLYLINNKDNENIGKLYPFLREIIDLECSEDEAS